MGKEDRGTDRVPPAIKCPLVPCRVTEVERDEHYRVKTAIKGEPFVLDM